MTKEKLLKITQELLKTENQLDFPLKLEQEELELLVASIGNGLDNNKHQKTEHNR